MNSYKGTLFCFIVIFLCITILCTKTFANDIKDDVSKITDIDSKSTVSSVLKENNPILFNGNEIKMIEENANIAVEVSETGGSYNGRIIRKSMSPYSANTNYSNIYLNNSTGYNINIGKLVSEKLSFNIKKTKEPEILIMHTHTTEAYMTTEKYGYTNLDIDRSANTNENIVAVGENLKNVLTKKGFSVIHDTTIHDYPAYTGSYSRSAETVTRCLEEYKSIKIVIDLHRDSITSENKDKRAPVIEVNGKKAAQIMIVMGSESGNVKDYPLWQENLKLALKIQQVTETIYPGFARPILLKSAKYNQNLSCGSILVEVGSEVNTVEEAIYSSQLLGETLSVALNSLN